MKYMGSKRRYAKHLLPIILKDRKSNQWYVEPFVGGCNMIDKVDGKRIGNDSNYYLIEMWKALQNGWIPPGNVSNEEYIDIKNNIDNFPPELVSFVGFNCSFGSMWFKSYARNNRGANYAREGKNSLLKQRDKILGIKFVNKNYLDLKLKSKCIIYCDPPYKGVAKYKDEFDHEEFWNWVRRMKEFGHSVFVSEYNAPDDFKCIKEIEATSTIAKTKNCGFTKSTEKLFI